LPKTHICQRIRTSGLIGGPEPPARAQRPSSLPDRDQIVAETASTTS
jgi:hypothetical protein